MYNYINKLYEEVGKYENLEQIADISCIRRRNFTCKVLNQLLKGKSGINILEIGPASGYITKSISPLIENNNSSLSILDFSESFLKSTLKTNSIHLKHSYVCDISSPSLAIEDSFDIVIFEEVVEHSVAPFVALVNINSMLEENGYLILTLPNTFYIKYLLFFYISICIRKRNSLLDTHIAELSPAGMVKLASMAGFSIESIDFYSCHRILPAKIIFSNQVGFVFRKISEPSSSWKELTKKIALFWENM